MQGGLKGCKFASYLTGIKEIRDGHRRRLRRVFNTKIIVRKYFVKYIVFKPTLNKSFDKGGGLARTGIEAREKYSNVTELTMTDLRHRGSTAG